MLAEIAAFAHAAFERANAGGTHRHHATAARLARGDRVHGDLRQDIALAVHFVFGDDFSFHRQKCACADMQRDVRHLNAAVATGSQRSLIKMQPRRRCRDSTLVLRVNRLVAGCVGNTGRTLHIRRQRQLTLLTHQRFKIN